MTFEEKELRLFESIINWIKSPNTAFLMLKTLTVMVVTYGLSNIYFPRHKLSKFINFIIPGIVAFLSIISLTLIYNCTFFQIPNDWELFPIFSIIFPNTPVSVFLIPKKFFEKNKVML